MQISFDSNTSYTINRNDKKTTHVKFSRILKDDTGYPTNKVIKCIQVKLAFAWPEKRNETFTPKKINRRKCLPQLEPFAKKKN